MLLKEVVLGECYQAKISQRLVIVKLIEKAAKPHRGWFAKNLTTGRDVHIKSAAKLRRKAFTFEIGGD